MRARTFLRSPGCIGLTAVVLLLTVGCARNKFERAFGSDYAPRPADGPVEVTVAETVDEAVREAVGVAGTLPPPAGRFVGWAYGEAPGLEGAIEALKGQVREMGGDSVHVDAAKVTFLGCSASGLVYRKQGR